MESVLMQGHLLKELLYSITSILDRAEAACKEQPVNIIADFFMQCIYN